ncbi:MAG: hypothetical protein IJ452_04900 [Butyricicoccus sp.]|nr:hypothetical protein [Butyricicoccus sp.]MBQ8585606.1 hypothetical protein [Butyricicoccus sp.]
MIESILSATGLPFRRARFLDPPGGTYAVYTDDCETDGADPMGGDMSDVPAIVTHSPTIELYEPAPDDAAEESVESALGAAGLTWTKQDRYWLQEEQRYQVVYETSYTTKRRK